MGGRAVHFAALAYALLLPAGALLLASSIYGYPLATVGVAFLFFASLAHLSLAFGQDETPLPSGYLVVPAIFTAVVLIAVPPPLSDDVYRYLFDGTCVVEGFSPFSHAPDSSKVSDLVAALPGRINHAELPTIYPPFAQLLFGGVALMGASVLIWKLFLLSCVVAGAFIARRVRTRLGAVDTGSWLFAHPLALVTAAGNANVDAVGVLLMAGVCWALHERRDWLVGVLLGLAAGLKLFPLGLFTARLGRSGIRGAAKALIVGAIILAAFYAPVFSSGPKALGSLGRYAEAWEFNSSIHALLTAAIDNGLRSFGVADSVAVGTNAVPTYYDGVASFGDWRSRRELASTVAKLVGVGFTGLVVLMCWRRRWEFEKSAAWILSALFLTAAVVHPWYLLWVLVPAALSGHRFSLAWCASVTAAFWAPAILLNGGEWADPSWVRWLEYGFVAGFAAIPCASLTRRPSRA